MPIATDATRLSIEFGYEYQTPAGDVLQYQMKFMHSPVGPTVTISNGPYEPVELPAQMFTEVAEFLINQGVLRGAKPPVVLGGAAPSGLGMPQIIKKGAASTMSTRPAPNPVEAISQKTEEELAEEAAAKAKKDSMLEARRQATEKAAKAGKNIKSHHRADE